jgi:UDP-N-acetylglucosamine diphosphorylase/glucosamine-1-phosphate N-acetyltransferase
MQIVLFEDAGYVNLLPLVYWRSCGELRCGCGTLIDQVRAVYPEAALTLYVRSALAAVTTERTGLAVNEPPRGDRVLFLNARALLRGPIPVPDMPAARRQGDAVVWAWAPADRLTPETLLDSAVLTEALRGVREAATDDDVSLMAYPWDLVHANAAMIEAAWARTQPHEIRGTLCPGVHLLERDNIAIGEGSRLKPGVTLDAQDGPILIGRDVTIQPNVSVQGPCYIGDRTLIQPGASIGEGTSIGPVCKVGGEIEGTIVHAYSNKQHDGFVGHAYVGEFVNLAADTIASDLKNTYGPVRVPINGREIDSGRMFVGLTIGDHSKTGIGQLFATGAVVGFGSSIATGGLAPKWVPSFWWVTDGVSEAYDPDRCIRVAQAVMARRQRSLSEAELTLFRQLPSVAAGHEAPVPASSARGNAR